MRFWTKSADDSFKFCSNLSAINNRVFVKSVLNNEIKAESKQEVV
jgi:hypothetical protein